MEGFGFRISGFGSRISRNPIPESQKGFGFQISGNPTPWCRHTPPHDLIVSSIYDQNSVGPSIRPIGTRFCFTMTHMIQVCSNFYQVRAFIIHSGPDEISAMSQPTPASSVCPYYLHESMNTLFSYTKVYSVIYDSGSVPRRVIFSPRETFLRSASSALLMYGRTMTAAHAGVASCGQAPIGPAANIVYLPAMPRSDPMRLPTFSDMQAEKEKGMFSSDRSAVAGT